MNYEKAYKDALERAKYLKETTDSVGALDVSACFEEIFPELKESEDEKIRKEMIDFMSSQLKSLMPPCPSNEKLKTWISWLEKQKPLNEQEVDKIAKSVRIKWTSDFINYLDSHKYEGKMCVSNGECEDIEDAFISADWDKIYRYYQKYLQKPVEWSEEDSERLNNLIDFIQKYGLQYYASTDKVIDWLKSLRLQPHWKPSEEQMEALKYFISFHEDHARSLTTKWEEFKNLESLYNDLKSL